MNGVVVEQMATLEEAGSADAVIVGSGIATREVVEDPAIMGSLRSLDAGRQLLAGQCSGTLVLAEARIAERRPGLHGSPPPSRGSWSPAWKCSISRSSRKDNLATAGGASRRPTSPPGSSRGSRASRRPRAPCTTSLPSGRKRSTSLARCATSRPTCTPSPSRCSRGDGLDDGRRVLPGSLLPQEVTGVDDLDVAVGQSLAEELGVRDRHDGCPRVR